MRVSLGVRLHFYKGFCRQIPSGSRRNSSGCGPLPGWTAPLQYRWGSWWKHFPKGTVLFSSAFSTKLFHDFVSFCHFRFLLMIKFVWSKQTKP